MIDKIPVGATIVRAYGFAFGNIVSNLGAIWIPAVLLWVAMYFFYRPHSSMAVQAAFGDPQAMARALPYFFAAFLVMFVLLTCQMAALTKEALGLRTGNAFMQFPFGAPMWRLLANYVLFALAMIAIYVAVFVALLVGALMLGLVASQISGTAEKLILALVSAIGVIVVLCGTAYAAVRLSFLLAPVAVAEQRVTIVRGWQLTRGNFWRIFAILLSVLIPLIMLDLIYVYAIYGRDFLPPMGAGPDALAQWQQHQQQVAAAAMERTQQYWYIIYPLGLLIGAVLYGLFAAISAFGYRALVPLHHIEKSA